VRRGLTPGIAAAREFFVGDMEMDTPRIGVDFDLIPGAHESGPPAAMRLSHLKPAGRAQRGRLIVLAQKMLQRRWLVYEQQFAAQPLYSANIDT
jgi:hypothetical protein